LNVEQTPNQHQHYDNENAQNYISPFKKTIH
jgi:hypothetical protein